MRWLAALILFTVQSAAWGAWACLPKEVGGTGTYYNLTTTADGYSLQWVCATANGSFIQDLTWLKAFTPTAACTTSVALPGLAALPVALDTANRLIASCATYTSGPNGYTEMTLNGVFQAGLVATRALYAADHPAAGPIYRTPNVSQRIYAVTPSGTLGATIPGAAASPSSLCDCALFTTSIGSSKYCALAGGVATQCTYCVKVGQ